MEVVILMIAGIVLFSLLMQVLSTLEGTTKDMWRLFSQQDKRPDALNKSLESICGQLSSLEQRWEHAEQRLDERFSERLDSAMEQLDSVSEAVWRLVEGSLTPYEEESQ